MWCQTPTRPSPLGRPGGSEKYQRPERSPSSTSRVPSGRKPRCSANGSCSSERRERARALQPEDPVLGRDVVGDGGQRRVGRVGHHQLDLVVLGVPEDERLRLRRVQPQHLRVVLVGDQPVHPELERVVGGDAQDHPVDVAVAGHARLGLVELEERDDAAAVALLGAEVRVVAERRLEVERVLDEPQAHHAAPEVDVRGDVAGDAREVVRSLQRLLHAFSSLERGARNLHNRNSAVNTSAR